MNNQVKKTIYWTSTILRCIIFTFSAQMYLRDPRIKFSKVGDSYKYQILDFSDNKYYISVEIAGQNQFYRSILYPL